MRSIILLVFIALSVLQSCRKESEVVPPTEIEVPQNLTYHGFYLLNEGNMGSNSSTLDFYNASSGIYQENIYGTANPNVVKELGDVGNDLQIYGSKLYAVINASNKIDIMNVENGKKIGQINVSNPRYIKFHKNKGYITSYAGEIAFGSNTPIGEVIEFDTTTFAITNKVKVGYQPEELAIVGDKLYVANSGGYRFPDYDNTVSVIDLNSFEEIKKITVAINLHRIKKAQNGNLYISSRGDYNEVPSKMYVLNPTTDQLIDSINIPCNNFALKGDSAYVISSSWDWSTGTNNIQYHIIDLKTAQVLDNSFIGDEIKNEIKIPYGIAINPISEEIYLTDVIDYVSPGKLYVFDKSGVFKWKVTTGDIPAHIAIYIK